MWKKMFALILCLATLVSLCACGGKETEEPGKTLSVYTDISIFKDIPCMDEENLKVIDADDYGNLDFVLVLEGMKKEGYDAYVKKLAAAGYAVFADNGATGIGNSIFSTSFTKDNLTLTVSYMPRLLRTYITAGKDKALSPHMIYDPSYVEGNVPGAKTTLTMHQLVMGSGGNCYILQLKNGHFIVCDGGDAGDYEEMVDYMETLIPEGERPYIEAWFLSHDHGDHLGFLQDVGGVSASRVTVEGIYYNKMSSEVQKLLGANNMIGIAETALRNFYTADNKPTPFYRCHAGDRFYFNDISVDVIYTNEQILPVEYTGNYNSSCTWLMFNIEGQKFLNGGDAEIVNMRHVDAMMDPSYMDVDMMNVHHHGVNVYLDNLDYYKCETLLYSGWCTYTVYYPQEIRQGMLDMQDYYSQEYMSYVHGSVVLEFPYTVGTYEILPTRRPELTKYYSDRQVLWMQEIGRPGIVH